MKDLFSLAKRKGLVTGGSRGIGLAVAQGLLQQGAEIVVTGRKPESLEATAAQLCSAGAPVHTEVCHQGDPAAVSALFQRLDQRGFTAEIVVVNAATNPAPGPLLDVDLAGWQKVLAVNLTGAWWTAKEAAKRMIGLGKGTIILVSSIAGLDPMPGIGAYSVSKAGLIGLTKALAKELAPKNVRVNALAPGLTETRFAAALFQDRETYEKLLATIPMGRHGQPADLVGAAIFLASDASAYMTGQVVVVDGGSRM